MRREPGAIAVSRDGASLPDPGGDTFEFAWGAVDRIVAYKVDLLTTDAVCLEFAVGPRTCVATEEVVGWKDLTAEMERRFPILDSWFWNVAQPPLATNSSGLWDRGVQEATSRMVPSQIEQLWQRCRPDFAWDGALRDVFIPNTTVETWNGMLAVARGMFGRVTITSDSPPWNHDLADRHFKGRRRAHVDFAVGTIEMNGYCFASSEIELSFAPEQVESSGDFAALLRFIVSTATFIERPIVITPENAPDLPILKVEPTGEIQFIAPA